MSEQNASRRKFIKAAAYTAPVILTLKAAPTFAKSGSMPGHHRGHRGHHRGHHQGRHHSHNGRHQGHRRRWWR